MTAFSKVFRAAASIILLASGAFVTDLSAQPKPDRAPAVEAAPDRPDSLMDADEVRRAFMSVLERHPPSVARVLKLDPSLMRNESYLQAYPQIAQFLATHPDIPRNALYYLEHVRVSHDDWQQTPQQRMTEAILAGLAGFTAFIIVISTLVWLIRTVVEHRRWNRLSKIQAEVHTKLMDRFSSNEELLTYVQTPSGRRFLESGPSPLQEMTPTMSAPLSRILWSVQLGSVLLVSGLGMLFLSGRALSEAQEFFYIGGCLASAIGTGFVVSAAAAYVLSRRLGLLERPVHDHA